MNLSKTSRRLHGTDNTIRLDYQHDVPYRDESLHKKRSAIALIVLRYWPLSVFITDLLSLIADNVLSNKRSFLSTILYRKASNNSTALNNSIGSKRYMSLVAGFPRPAGLVDGRCSASEVTSEPKLAIGGFENENYIETAPGRR